MPTNWKYIKKQPEKAFLCPPYMVTLPTTSPTTDPPPWYQQHFIMKYDDEILLEAKQTRCEFDSRYRHPPITDCLKRIFRLRFEVEGIPYSHAYEGG